MMSKINSLRLSLTLALISLLTFSGTTNTSLLASTSFENQEEKANWETYTTTGEEFSVRMPELPGVNRSIKCLDSRCTIERVDNTYAAYSNGVVYYVRSYQSPHTRLSLEEIIAESTSGVDMNSSDTAKTDVKFDNFKGKKFISVSKPHGYDVLSAFYLTSNHVYEVTAVGGNRNDAGIQEFFKSFALGSKKGTEIGAGARIITASLDVLASPKTEAQNSKVTQPEGYGAGLEKVSRSSEVTRKAIIVLKPSPEYTEEARKNLVAGTVTLQMVFASTGKVTNIRTISGLEFGLTEKAIAAARKIYFLPAIKDEKRVNQWIRVEYNFHIY